MVLRTSVDVFMQAVQVLAKTRSVSQAVAVITQNETDGSLNALTELNARQSTDLQSAASAFERVLRGLVRTAPAPLRSTLETYKATLRGLIRGSSPRLETTPRRYSPKMMFIDHFLQQHYETIELIQKKLDLSRKHLERLSVPMNDLLQENEDGMFDVTLSYLDFCRKSREHADGYDVKAAEIVIQDVGFLLRNLGTLSRAIALDTKSIASAWEKHREMYGDDIQECHSLLTKFIFDLDEFPDELKRLK